MSRTEIIETLKQLTGPDQVLTGPADLEHYGQDWTRFKKPAPLAIVLPKSIEQVQKIVLFANEKQLALVPSGGRTGLSGGALASQGEVIISLNYLNKIQHFNSTDRTVVCQAGVITEQLQQFAEEKELFYPVNFASAGSSQIGGNIATNAGGIKVIRYGMTRQWIAGLKVITGKGELIELNQGLEKNNTGYDLRHLFIGSEGTLGIIVEATIKLTKRPSNLTALLLGVTEMAAIMNILHHFQKKLDLTAFEFFSEPALLKVMESHGERRPLESNAPFYTLLEFEAVNDQVVEDALVLFEECLEKGWVIDGVMSQNQTQYQNLWQYREGISEAITPYLPYKNDISVCPAKIPEFLQEVQQIVGQNYPDFEIIWFGHIGDGNLHLNILKPDNLDKSSFVTKCEQVNTLVFTTVKKYGGSISAEHGVGLLKKEYLPYSRSAAEIELMRGIKQCFDPNGIMNPGKIFDL